MNVDNEVHNSVESDDPEPEKAVKKDKRVQAHTYIFCLLRKNLPPDIEETADEKKHQLLMYVYRCTCF